MPLVCVTGWSSCTHTVKKYHIIRVRSSQNKRKAVSGRVGGGGVGVRYIWRYYKDKWNSKGRRKGGMILKKKRHVTIAVEGGKRETGTRFLLFTELNNDNLPMTINMDNERSVLRPTSASYVPRTTAPGASYSFVLGSADKILDVYIKRHVTGSEEACTEQHNFDGTCGRVTININIMRYSTWLKVDKGRTTGSCFITFTGILLIPLHF